MGETLGTILFSLVLIVAMAYGIDSDTRKLKRQKAETIETYIKHNAITEAYDLYTTEWFSRGGILFYQKERRELNQRVDSLMLPIKIKADSLLQTL